MGLNPYKVFTHTAIPYLSHKNCEGTDLQAIPVSSVWPLGGWKTLQPSQVYTRCHHHAFPHSMEVSETNQATPAATTDSEIISC